MANELKATVINLKSLSQNIPDPITVGAGDASGRKLRVIFTQEAAAQFTPYTKVYLSWKHQEKDIKGYNVFTEIVDETDEDFPPTWEISFPKAMLYEGNVLACIEIVDTISIAASVNFNIHVVANPNIEETFTQSDDYSDFQIFVVQLNELAEQMNNQMEEHAVTFEEIQENFAGIQNEFANMQIEFEQIQQLAEDTEENSALAKQYSDTALATVQIIEETIDNIYDTSAAAQQAAANAVQIATDQQTEIATLKSQVSNIGEYLNNLNTDQQIQAIYEYIDNKIAELTPNDDD